MKLLIMTPSLLHTLLHSHPQLPKSVWYIVCSVTLSALNRPEEIATVFRVAVGIDEDDAPAEEHRVKDVLTHDGQLRIARRIREALIKSAAVLGVPKTINALLLLKSATPDVLLDLPDPQLRSSRTIHTYDTPPRTIISRGEEFFDRVYGKVSKRVMDQMDDSGTEDLGVLARIMYGYVLSNTEILSALETSYVAIAGLIPLDVNPQLKGHLKGALNSGATTEEVQAVRSVCLQLCEAAGMRRLQDQELGGWGWREDVANV